MVATGGGAADITTAVATAPLAFVRVGQPTGSPTQAMRTTGESTIDQAMENQVVNNTASAATIGDSLGTLPVILFNLLFVAPFAIVFFGLILVVSLIQNYFYNRENATAATLASDPMLSDSARVTTAMEAPADAKPATESGKADVAPQVRSIDKRTHTEQVSTDVATSKRDVTETVEAEEESTGPTVVKTSESSASDSTFETAKPAGRPDTPRPVVRDSLGAGKQSSEQSHPGNGGRPTSRTADAGDDAPTAGPSSDGNPSGDDADS
jgi:hypothetical protein